jgi:hypothetical protein
MVPPPHAEEDPVVEFLVKRCGPTLSADSPETCPSDGVLMGLAGGRLLPGEKEAFEAHVTRCERCRAVVDLLMQGERAGIRKWVSRPWAAAAALLLAVAGAVAISTLFRGSPREELLETDGRLVAAARDLARVRPELFGDFAPLSRDERLAANPVLRAGDLALLYPSGNILETRPTFRWEADPNAGEEEILLRTAGGRTIWRGRGKAPSLPYPPEAPELERGARYVWEVGDAGRRVFAVASAAEGGAFEAALREIEASAPADLRRLLRAHFALRLEFYGEAEEAARAYVEARPDDPVGRETLAHVLRKLGSSEAEHSRGR